ncbi:MAG: NTP transferase domain-containing protein [Devosia nanyangense]|uniref:Molybdenum cofactor guanylyltransferase n=1 Tax=Devosia nanyangense TaxID=1228055 RepID=A0A933L6A2_9HYPH|nr:NTP transferase domain-containing protein [Devosia nanyangense]
MDKIAAVILAGGRGERLGGVNKALIEIGGKRLLDRVREALAGCEPILLSVGGAAFGVAAFPLEEQVLDLATGYGGPLAGVAAALERLADDPPDLLLSVAVDTPFFPADFVARALPLLDTAPAVVAAYAGQTYPTNALWRFAALSALPAQLRAGAAPHSLKRLAAALGAAPLDYAGSAGEDPFANVNTPADLAALRRRAQA